jgi:tight adherence protein C
MSFLDTINDILTSQLGPFGPLIAMGGLGVFLILLTVALLMNQPEDPLKKLQRSQVESRKTEKKEQLRQRGRNEKLERFATFLEPKDAEELSAMQLKMRQAGYRSKDAVRFFHFAQFALGLLGLLLGFLYVLSLKNDAGGLTSQQLVIYVIGPGAVGYLLPKYWITRRVAERKEEIAAGFPDSLDMMLVCVEAGQSLDQSIVRVANELTASYPALASEDKDRVLRDMGTRCGVPDVSSFVTVMIQSATFGTSIAEALRVYASEMRDKRVMRAEEAANKLPTKMTLATMMLTVPPLLIILVGPSVRGIMDLGNMGN